MYLLGRGVLGFFVLGSVLHSPLFAKSPICLLGHFELAFDFLYHTNYPRGGGLVCRSK
jgi:hypothetical protein